MGRNGKPDKLASFLESARASHEVGAAPEPKVGGTQLLYINEARDTWIAYNYASELKVSTRSPYLDKAGSNMALRKLLSEVSEGDTIVVGSITDLANPTVSDMLLILEAMQMRGVVIRAKMQPNYSLAEYQTAIQLMQQLFDDWEFSLKHVK